MARDRMRLWARHYSPGDEQAFEPARPPLHEHDWSKGTPGPTWTLVALHEAAKVMHRIGPIYRHLPITADAADAPACRCLEKLGFIDTGERRSHPGIVFHVYRRML